MSSISILKDDNLYEDKNKEYKLSEKYKDSSKNSINRLIYRSNSSLDKPEKIKNENDDDQMISKFITPVKLFNPKSDYFQKLDEIQSKYTIAKNKHKPSILSKIGLDILNSNRVLTNFNKKNRLGNNFYPKNNSSFNTNNNKNNFNSYNQNLYNVNHEETSKIFSKKENSEKKNEDFLEIKDIQISDVDEKSKEMTKMYTKSLENEEIKTINEVVLTNQSLNSYGLNQKKNEYSLGIMNINTNNSNIETNTYNSNNTNNSSDNNKYRKININNINLSQNIANNNTNQNNNYANKVINEKYRGKINRENTLLVIPEINVNSTATLNSSLVLEMLNNIDMTKENINSSYKSIILNSSNLNNTFDIENLDTLTEGKLHKSYLWEDQNFIKSIKLLEFWLDIENALDNKNIIISLLRRMFLFIKNEISENEQINSFSFEFFQISNLNKMYSKFLKILVLICTSFYIIHHNMNLDNSLKGQMKKLASSFSMPFLNFFEFLFFNNKKNLEKMIDGITLKIDFIDKYNKNLKSHKIAKGTKAPEALINIIKNLDSTLLLIKQFSNVVFKYSLVKPFHIMVFDIVKFFDKYNFKSFSKLITENILYGIINKSLNKEPKSNSPFDIQLENIINDPFLPSISSNYEYTLVLDLDETLIHFFYTQTSGMFFMRPYAKFFLQELYEMYEIVIFTAATKDYADEIINVFDPNRQLIKHRLYRNHTSILGLNVIKDLSKLGRDLSKIIIIDNIAENFKLQPFNGLEIKTWNDDIKDTNLLDLTNILKDLYTLRIQDVRNIIKKIKEEVNQRINKGNYNWYNNIDISKFF